MKLKLTINRSVVIDTEVDIHEELADQLAGSGLKGVVGKDEEDDIQDAIREMYLDDPSGLIETDETDLKVEVLEGSFDIGNAAAASSAD